MTPLKSLKRIVGISAALLLMSSSAHAAVTWTTWNFNNNINNNAMNVGPAGNRTNATAWGNTGGNTGANSEYRRRSLCVYGNLGLGSGCSERNGQHAVDNKGVHEFILLQFQKPTTLKQLQIGWPSRGYDTDMTVLAFTGAAQFPTFARSDLTSRNSDTGDTSGPTRGLTNAGWDLISNLSNVSTGGLRSIGNSGNVASSYWLVGAYNRFISGNSLINDGYDYFKLKAVKGHSGRENNVPLPTTAALLGLGLLALGRKRFQLGK